VAVFQSSCDEGLERRWVTEVENPSFKTERVDTVADTAVKLCVFVPENARV